jgi:transposase-like protein
VADCVPAAVRLWESAWAEFVPFLGFANDIREIIYTTNAIESVNARIRKGGQGPRSFPQRPGRVEMRVVSIMTYSSRELVGVKEVFVMGK